MKTEEQKLKEIIAQGSNADAWLNHPHFKHVVTVRKAQLMAAFEKTGYRQKAEREEIWRKMQALSAIENDFRRVIRDAQNAKKTLIERLKDVAFGL